MVVQWLLDSAYEHKHLVLVECYYTESIVIEDFNYFKDSILLLTSVESVSGVSGLPLS